MQQFSVDRRISSRRYGRDGGRRATDRPVSSSSHSCLPVLWAKCHDPCRRS